LLKIAIWMPDTTGMSLTTDKSGIETEARVDASGSISVPSIGRLSAAGHMPAQIEQDIAARLAKQSPGAQVALLVAEDVTNDVIVQGAVSKPGRYPIVPNSSGLLDILAVAGGPQTPNYQALVRITRADTAVTRTLTHLLDDTGPGLDLAPGDRILVQPRRSYFYAFGDVMRPGEQPYDADEISLARILARLDGLADNRADPAAVFVYRRQSADLTQRIAPVAIGQDATRVIYRLNLRDPGGFFVSEAFPVLPDDLIYVSDAPITEATKVFQVVTGLSSIGAIPRNFGAPY
jgi:polysaccharide export outer membrane protein